MATLQPSLIKPSGTLDGYVFVRGKTKTYMRKQQEPGLAEDRPHILKEKNRTAFFSQLASRINRVIKAQCPDFYETDFYHRMLKRLRQERLDNRFLILRTLKNIEVHNGYPLSGLSNTSVEVEDTGDDVRVNLRTGTVRKDGANDADCYDYELLLMSWDDTDVPVVETQLSQWIKIDNKRGTMAFHFTKRQGLAQWVLFLRQRLGKTTAAGSVYMDAKAAEAMQLVEVGSCNSEDWKLLEEKTQNAVKDAAPVIIETLERKGVFSPD